MKRETILVMIAVTLLVVAALGSYTDYRQNLMIKDLMYENGLLHSAYTSVLKTQQECNQLALEALDYAVRKGGAR